MDDAHHMYDDGQVFAAIEPRALKASRGILVAARVPLSASESLGRRAAMSLLDAFAWHTRRLRLTPA